jgi:hypothetical protein
MSAYGGAKAPPFQGVNPGMAKHVCNGLAAAGRRARRGCRTYGARALFGIIQALAGSAKFCRAYGAEDAARSL